MASGTRNPWTLDDIAFDDIDVGAMRRNDDLMCLLCAASFIESGSDIYTGNLVEHYAGEDDIRAWLNDHWQWEELQHGRALAAFVTRVWPDFDWDATFAEFLEDYRKVSTVDQLEPSRCLEMAARCVVEMGTATLYRSIHDHVEEPVLRDLTNHIRSDEVHHYSYFYKYFRRYQADPATHCNRSRVLRALVRRLREIGNEDGEIALHHVFAARHPEYLDDKAAYRQALDRIYGQVRADMPVKMAVKMLLRPLDLPPAINARVEPSLSWLATRIKLH